MTQGRVTFSDGSPADGVVIALGGTVTRTDRSGRYNLKGPGRFVVLSRPDGWKADPWYRDGEAEVADFVLEPAPTDNDFRFVQVTDLHVSTRAEPAVGLEVPRSAGPVTEALGRVAAGGVSMIVATGDLTDTGTDDEFQILGAALRGLTVEVVVVPGNHDHMAGAPAFLVTDSGYAVNRADPSAWERHLGPRWYSLTRGGVRFVVIDWHTWELGLDRNQQESWLSAELDTLDGRSWVLLSHDQMPDPFFESLSLPPIASFSGHWHTSRVVRIGPTIHVNTPPLTFAGLDHAPAAAVTVEFTSGGLELDRVAPDYPDLSAPDIEPVWQVSSGQAAGLAGPVRLDDELVGFATWDDTAGTGTFIAVDGETGETRWSRELSVAVKAQALVSGGRLVFADVAGGLETLDPKTGTRLWRREAEQPLRTWCWAGPISSGDSIVLGLPSRVVSVHPETGETIWERKRLVPHANLLAHSGPVAAAGLIIIGFWPFSPELFALDAGNGEVRWTVEGPDARPIEGATGSGIALGTGSPMGPGAVVADRVVFPTAGGWTCLDPTDGAVLWRAGGGGRFRPGRPAAVGDIVVVTSSDEVLGIRTIDGGVVWSHRLPRQGIALAPYRSTPHAGTAGPVVLDGKVMVPGLDGYLRRYQASDGESVGSITLGIRSAATPLVVDDLLVLLGLDGTLTAFDLEEVAA